MNEPNTTKNNSPTMNTIELATMIEIKSLIRPRRLNKTNDKDTNRLLSAHYMNPG